MSRKCRSSLSAFEKPTLKASNAILETGEKHFDWTYIELPGLHKDGHEIPLAISFGEFTHDSEQYFVGLFRDISERKAVEQQLERQNERLDRFASMLAHELRNPLEVAQIYLDFIDSNGLDDSNISQVADALNQIDEIIDILLVLARNEAEIGAQDPVPLSEIAANAWANTNSGAAELEVETDIQIQMKATHLRHFLENLFRNAIEHSSSPVTVRVGVLEEKEGFC